MKTQTMTAIDPGMFLDAAQRSVEPRAGQIGFSRMCVKSINEDKRQIHFVCSTGEVDRYGEIVDPSAYADALDGFMTNPVFQAGHVYVGTSGEPTTIGSWLKLWITQDGLEGIAHFDDEEPLAIRYWNLYRKGHMRAVSVGFISRAWEMREMSVPGSDVKQRVRVFTAVELIEISAVAIPANRGAVARAAALSGSATHAAPDDDEALVKQLQPAIERSLINILEAGPASPIWPHLMGMAECVQASGNHSVDYFSDPAPGSPGSPGSPGPESYALAGDEGGNDVNEDESEIKAALADVLKAAAPPAQ